MNLPNLKNERFTNETGVRVSVQVPDEHAQEVIDTVLTQENLKYGDYDCVSFKTSKGIQQFRSLPEGRNAATEDIIEVPCREISFFLGNDEPRLIEVLKAIYGVHPYEEPVIFITPCLRTLHKRGLDEDNPNRFWNRKDEKWIPEQHRKL